MTILFVCAEADPFIKTGGLADVSYALPKALRKQNIDVRVILPKYGSIAEKYKSKMRTLSTYTIQLGWRDQYCGLQYLEYDGIPFYFIDNEYYFNRENPYGYDDDGERFSFFDKAVIQAIDHMGDFYPQVIHCNDWHTGMIAPLLRCDNKYDDIKSVFTIHNLQFQGVFSKSILGDFLGLDDSYYTDEKLKFYDGVSFMKGGIVYSDIISTVSNTYKDEIKTPMYGEKLDGVINTRDSDLYGIVNGIDDDLFNPSTDSDISYNFGVDKFDDKAKNKTELQEELGLKVDANIPMIGLISRLSKQKGLDLICRVLYEIMQNNVQFVILGKGESQYEDFFKNREEKYSGKLSVNLKMDSVFAKKIYASSDMFLMPSLFEPCGIGQLLALRYGTIPIVRETGGLKDTVIPFNEFENTGNGFTFANYNAHDMAYTIKRAIHFYDDKEVWKSLASRAMDEDYSWKKSANKYIELYERGI